MKSKAKEYSRVYVVQKIGGYVDNGWYDYPGLSEFDSAAAALYALTQEVKSSQCADIHYRVIERTEIVIA